MGMWVCGYRWRGEGGERGRVKVVRDSFEICGIDRGYKTYKTLQRQTKFNTNPQTQFNLYDSMIKYSSGNCESFRMTIAV